MSFVPLTHALAQPRQKRRGGHGPTIYALVDSRGGVRYVGQTRAPLQARLDRHGAHPTNAAMAGWLAQGRPRIAALEQVSDAEWEDAERGWIAWFRQRGELLNVDPGGEYRTNVGAPRRMTFGEFQPPQAAERPRAVPPGIVTPDNWKSIKKGNRERNRRLRHAGSRRGNGANDCA